MNMTIALKFRISKCTQVFDDDNDDVLLKQGLLVDLIPLCLGRV
jgi:hypothetical protein